MREVIQLSQSPLVYNIKSVFQKLGSAAPLWQLKGQIGKVQQQTTKTSIISPWQVVKKGKVACRIGAIALKVLEGIYRMLRYIPFALFEIALRPFFFLYSSFKGIEFSFYIIQKGRKLHKAVGAVRSRDQLLKNEKITEILAAKASKDKEKRLEKKIERLDLWQHIGGMTAAEKPYSGRCQAAFILEGYYQNKLKNRFKATWQRSASLAYKARSGAVIDDAALRLKWSHLKSHYRNKLDSLRLYRRGLHEEKLCLPAIAHLRLSLAASYKKAVKRLLFAIASVAIAIFSLFSIITGVVLVCLAGSGLFISTTIPIAISAIAACAHIALKRFKKQSCLSHSSVKVKVSKDFCLINSRYSKSSLSHSSHKLALSPSR